MWQPLDNCVPDAHVSVQIFRLALPATLEACEPLRVFLSAEELGRLQRFKVESSAIQYLQLRSALRIILGARLGVAPQQMSFEYSEFGKPLLHESAGPTPSFNVSHTDGWGLIALSASGAVGVDVEKHNPNRDLEAVAWRNFSPQECETVLGQASASLRCDAFFDTWTAKEACIKALGTGIGSQLRGFTVALGAPGALRGVEFRDDPVESSRWSLMGVPMPEGWSAAVAVRGEPGEPGCLAHHQPALYELGTGFWKSAR